MAAELEVEVGERVVAAGGLFEVADLLAGAKCGLSRLKRLVVVPKPDEDFGLGVKKDCSEDGVVVASLPYGDGTVDEGRCRFRTLHAHVQPRKVVQWEREVGVVSVMGLFGDLKRADEQRLSLVIAKLVPVHQCEVVEPGGDSRVIGLWCVLREGEGLLVHRLCRGVVGPQALKLLCPVKRLVGPRRRAARSVRGA